MTCEFSWSKLANMACEGKLCFVLKDIEHVRETCDAALRVIASYMRLNSENVLF